MTCRSEGVEEEGIDRLFMEAAEHAAQRTEDVRMVFSILVEGSLRYRDHIIETTGKVTTVEHVRTALKWLVPVLATGERPKQANDLSLGLLALWVEELAALGYPRVRVG